jgi:hypothetical protein
VQRQRGEERDEPFLEGVIALLCGIDFALLPL